MKYLDKMEDTCSNCGNTEMTFVLHIMKNGGKRLRKQCLKCGQSPSNAYKLNLVKDINKIPKYDTDLKQNFIDSCFTRRDLKNELGAKEYYNNVYLKSDEWKTKRENILIRDDYKCVCCEEKATQVHHINYNNVYNENNNLLLSVCKDCHNLIHNKGIVFFNGLKANFGELYYCQNCKKYNNNQNLFICNDCKNLN